MTVHDEVLANSVRRALSMDKRTGNLPIDVRACGGEVFLKGKVESLEERDVVQFIASGVSGVRHVDVQELDVTKETA